MSFGFGNAGAQVGFGASLGSQTSGNTNNQAQTGPELEEIQAEGLGFLALSGDRKIRLLQTSWPSDALPPPTSSLMSLASNKGLLAAAGPDMIVVASTESLRGQFTSDVNPGGADIVGFEPQLKIPVQMRVSHVVFSADESCLVISAEQGGGLAVYDVAALMQGTTTPAFELSTEGTPLRALTPNPTPEKAELLAAVTTDGELLIANLKERRFTSGPTGSVLKSGVSCVSWSTRGKQLVAGLGNGTASQMTPEGEEKAVIPAPPDLEGDQHVSSITWLENHVFLIVHTPTVFDTDSAPASTLNLVTRQPPSSFVFQKLADPSPPFGLNRSPPHHFMLRLKDFPPNLQDVLIVSSTASTDIGLVTRSKTPLTSEVSAEKITGVFTSTGIANDSRRAQLPMTEDMSDTSPIGMALDLSSKSTVLRPIVGEEIEHSASPLPALVVLNHEGVLAAWWVVYSESIRQETAYPGLALSEGAQPPQNPVAPVAKPVQSTSAFGVPSALATGSQAPASAFGAPTQAAASSFGTPSAPRGAFGSTSLLGTNRQSPWATPSASSPAQPSAAPSTTAVFGSSAGTGGASGGSAFGQTTGLGMRTGGVFGGAAPGAAPGSGNSQPSPAGGSGGGFGAYSNTGGFGTAAASTGTGESIFSKGRDASGPSIDGGMDTETSFGSAAKPLTPSGGPFGASGSGFKLGSSFKGDGTAKDDLPKPANAGGSFFGGAFGTTLGEAQKPPTAPAVAESEMGDDGNKQQPIVDQQQATPDEPRTPVPVPAPPKFTFPGTTTPGSLFGEIAKPEAHADPTPPHVTEHVDPSPAVKNEPDSDEDHTPLGVDQSIPAAPLPPDTTSKTTYAAGDSSTSSVSTNGTVDDDAPLPPDFVASRVTSQKSPEMSEPALPSDDAGEDDEAQEEVEAPNSADLSAGETPPSAGHDDEGFDGEGSGVDVARELSPATQPFSSPKMTPQSSFGGSIGGSFMNVSNPAPQPSSRRLFGEIESGPVPQLPPPHPKSQLQASPRSPSPVRHLAPTSLSTRPDNARSVSTPIVISPVLLGARRAGWNPTPTPIPSWPYVSPEEQKLQERTRLAKMEAEREQSLQDTQDERIHEELRTDVEATKTLEPFVAHQDYVGRVTKPGMAGQIERLYRDINSMVDTLGLNTRSLQGFIKGHSELYKDGGRTRDDLEDEDDWCLLEIDDLVVVENELSEQLDQGRVQDVQGMLEQCNALRKDLLRVRAKHNDIKKIIDSQTDPEVQAAVRSFPLSSEQVTQQNDLRKDFTKFQELLATAEENISLLRAKVASQQGKNGSQAARPVPTVEAVMKTIMKMTSMAEEKSGDVDVLENQMRKLRFSSVESTASREGSPFAASASRGSPLRTLPTNGLGRSFTPEAASRSTRASFRASVNNSSPYSRNGTPRKHISAVTDEEAEYVKVKIVRRKNVAAKLKSALEKAGPRVKPMDG